MHLVNLIPILQAAVSPVTLISGVGLLILSMTNRLGRVVDRSRYLWANRQALTPDDHQRTESQIRILVRRAQLLRRAILFATISVLVAAVLVIDLFLSAYLRFDSVTLSVTLFVLCLLALIISLVVFLQEINLSLVALQMELGLMDDSTM